MIYIFLILIDSCFIWLQGYAFTAIFSGSFPVRYLISQALFHWKNRVFQCWHETENNVELVDNGEFPYSVEFDATSWKYPWKLKRKFCLKCRFPWVKWRMKRTFLAPHWKENKGAYFFRSFSEISCILFCPPYFTFLLNIGTDCPGK